MKQIYSIALLLLLLLSVSTGVSAQIKGVITDSLTHEPLMYITVQYEGKGVGGISNAEGEYQVETRKDMRTATFTPPAPVMPAAWPATNRVRPVKKRIPDTTDGPKRIGYYLEPLRGIASNPDRQKILKDFFKETYV